MAWVAIGSVFKEFDDSLIVSISENDQNQTRDSENILVPALATVYDTSFNVDLDIGGGNPAERDEWLKFVRTVRNVNKLAISLKNINDAKGLIKFTSIPILALQQSLCAFYTSDFQLFVATSNGINASYNPNSSNIRIGFSFNKINITGITSQLAPVPSVAPTPDPLDFQNPSFVTPPAA